MSHPSKINLDILKYLSEELWLSRYEIAQRLSDAGLIISDHLIAHRLTDCYNAGTVDMKTLGRNKKRVFRKRPQNSVAP
jgi:hypothetical protein